MLKVSDHPQRLLVLNVLLATVFFNCTIGRAASGPSAFIPAPHRVDMVEDTARNIAYVSSSDGNLLRYDLNTQGFLSPIALGGTPYGMDISPDGSTLAIANMSYSSSANWIDTVNLSNAISGRINLEVKKQWFPNFVLPAGRSAV
jgi:hypothetical protein